MKLIKKETLLAALLGGIMALTLVGGGVALAHGGPRGPDGPWSPQKMDQHLAEMTERLQLSADQTATVRSIMEQAAARAEAIREMPRGRAKLTAMRDLHFTTEDQIYANLSCEQREELRLLKREHRAERMEQRFERHADEGAN